MSWLTKTVARLRGGEQEAMRLAVASAFERRAWYDLAEVARQFNVTESAVREAANKAIKSSASALTVEQLVPEQRSALLDLGVALGASQAAIASALADAAKRCISDILEEMYSRGEVDHNRLDQISDQIGIRDNVKSDLLLRFGENKLRPVLESVLADKLVTPDEDAEITKVMARVGFKSLDPKTEATLKEARLLWMAVAGPLPVVHSPILLKRGEVCHHVIAAQAIEDRQRTVSIGFAGPTARIRIAKGLSYSVGSRSVSRKVETYHHSFGRGILCTTNKRLLWTSPEKTISFTLPSVVMTEPYYDGFLVRRASGKPITFAFDGSDHPGVALISRVIEEFR